MHLIGHQRSAYLQNPSVPRTLLFTTFSQTHSPSSSNRYFTHWRSTNSPPRPNQIVTLESDLDKEYVYDIDHGAEEFTPVWLDSLRGFHDFRTIEAERFNGLLAEHLPSEIEGWTCKREGWTFSLQDVELSVQNDRVGPLRVVASSDTMPRRVLDPLRAAVREIPVTSNGMFWSSTRFAVCLLQLVEEAASWQQEWHQRTGPSTTDPSHGWTHKDGSNWASILGNPNGLDLLTVEDKAAHLLGEPITNICSRVSEDIRILHIEPVFRSDLVSGHLKAKTRIHQQLLKMPKALLRKSVAFKDIPKNSSEDTVEGLAAHLARPSVTFHGAPRHVMNSIVRYGFVLPGKEIGESGKAVEVRCGSSYGRGVYSSPDPMYASSYTRYQSGTSVQLNKPSDVPGFRLVVCATLMGRALQVQRADARGSEDLLREDAHSHISPNKLEYIIFDAAQIIPCYVLHLDYGAEYAKAEFDRLVANPTQFFEKRQSSSNKTKNKWVEEQEAPGDVQRKKQNLKAAAAKWFPYGYGPASGTSFVIEEMAEVSDDEEEYGEFQYQRIEEENEMSEQHLTTGGNWFDEYQSVRKTKKEVDVSHV